MRILILLALLLTAACGAPENPNPGNMTRSEEAALEDAATMLDVNSTAPVTTPVGDNAVTPSPR